MPVIAVLAILLALAVTAGILFVGNIPDAFDGSPAASASASTLPSASEIPGDSPESAIRAFFEAFAKAGETNDADLIEPYVSSTESSAYQTAAGFLMGQAGLGKASVTTVNELSQFSVRQEDGRAVVEFTYVAGGYDIDAETGEALESPVVLPAERVRVVVVRPEGRWLVDSYEAIE
jgi:hypothetical protein